MKWFKAFFLMSMFGAIFSTMHGRTFYSRQRLKNARSAKAISEYNDSKLDDTPKLIGEKFNLPRKCSNKLKSGKNGGFKEFAEKAAAKAKSDSSVSNRKHMGRIGVDVGSEDAVAQSQEQAEAAMIAAKAAEAEMMVKSALLAQIEVQIEDKKHKLKVEEHSLEKANDTVSIIENAEKDADDLLYKLSDALEETNELVQSLELLHIDFENEINEKRHTLEESKMQVQTVLTQLRSAQEDFERTQDAAYKAAEACKTAKLRVDQEDRKRRLIGRRKRRRPRYRRRRRRPGGHIIKKTIIQPYQTIMQ